MKVQKLTSTENKIQLKDTTRPPATEKANEWRGLVKNELGRVRNARWEMQGVNYLMHLLACLKLMRACCSHLNKTDSLPGGLQEVLENIEKAATRVWLLANRCFLVSAKVFTPLVCYLHPLIPAVESRTG